MHEDNEESKLGELSEPLFRERGGFPPLARSPQYEPGQYVPGQGVPPDIAYQTKVARDAEMFGQLGTVKQSTYVTTTFDARPINGLDFLVQEKARIAFRNPNGDPAIDVPGEVSFVVPQGYVAILRQFGWSFEVPILPKDDNDNFEIGVVSAGIFINNVAQPFYTGLNDLGRNINPLVNTYLIAEVGQTITVRVQLGNIGSSATNTTLYDEDILMTLYGNLLLSRGLPAQFEPGSL